MATGGMMPKDNHPKPSTIMIAQLIKTNSTLSTTIARQDVRIDKLKEHIDYLKEELSDLRNKLDMASEDNQTLDDSIEDLIEENKWLKNKVDWDSNNYSEPDGRLH